MLLVEPTDNQMIGHVIQAVHQLWAEPCVNVAFARRKVDKGISMSAMTSHCPEPHVQPSKPEVKKGLYV